MTCLLDAPDPYAEARPCVGCGKTLTVRNSDGGGWCDECVGRVDGAAAKLRESWDGTGPAVSAPSTLPAMSGAVSREGTGTARAESGAAEAGLAATVLPVLSLPTMAAQIHKGQSPDIPGSLRLGPGPAVDPVQGEAAGASQSGQLKCATPANSRYSAASKSGRVAPSGPASHTNAHIGASVSRENAGGVEGHAGKRRGSDLDSRSAEPGPIQDLPEAGIKPGPAFSLPTTSPTPTPHRPSTRAIPEEPAGAACEHPAGMVG